MKRLWGVVFLLILSTGLAIADDNDREEHPDHSVRAGIGVGGTIRWNESTRSTSDLDTDSGEVTERTDDDSTEVTEDNRDGSGQVEANFEYINPYVFGRFDTDFATAHRGRLLLTPSYLAVGGELDIGTDGENATVNGTGQIGANYMDRNFRGFLVGLVGTDTPDLSDDEVVAFSDEQLMVLGLSGRAEWLLEDVNFIFSGEYRGMFQVDRDNLDLNRTEMSAHRVDLNARLEVPVIPAGPTSIGLFAEAGYGFRSANVRVFNTDEASVIDYDRSSHELKGIVGAVFYWDTNLERRREGRESSRSRTRSYEPTSFR